MRSRIMKKPVILLIVAVLICGVVSGVSANTVYDPLNHAANILQYTIAQAQHLEDLVEAGKQLLELKNLFKEFEFFNQQLINVGLGEIQDIVQRIRAFTTGGPNGALLPFKGEQTKTYLETLNNNPYFQGTALQIAQLEFLSRQAESGTTLPYYLSLVPDPLSPNHKYITYEQAEIAKTFDQAEDLREYSEELAKDGRDLEDAAAQANLLGAARLQAASMGKLYEAFGVLLASQGRIAELSAISIEQTSREEKLDELARRKAAQDMNEFMHGSGAPTIEIASGIEGNL